MWPLTPPNMSSLALVAPHLSGVLYTPFFLFNDGLCAWESSHHLWVDDPLSVFLSHSFPLSSRPQTSNCLLRNDIEYVIDTANTTNPSRTHELISSPYLSSQTLHPSFTSVSTSCHHAPWFFLLNPFPLSIPIVLSLTKGTVSFPVWYLLDHYCEWVCYQ